MRILLAVLALVVLAYPTRAQSTVTTVPSIAALLNMVPSTAKPEVHVLGNVTPNDGGGGDYIWVAGSVATTNAFDAIASPYGAAQGRWLKRISNRPILKDATLQGGATISPGGLLAVPSGASVVASSGSLVALHDTLVTKLPFTGGPLEVATVQEVTIRSISIATSLAAMKGITVDTNVNRMAFVRENTITGGISDNALGFWLWDPASGAAESPVVQKSNTFGPSDAGRWLKL